MLSTKPPQETAVLVAVATRNQSLATTKEYLEELAFLAHTLDIQVLDTFTQTLEKPTVRTLVRRGKLEEIGAFVRIHQVDIVIFDDELTPSQVRNLETHLKCRILDRSLLILEVFAMRAQTNQAKTQVELAQYQYLLPRLTKMWSHLSKQQGGVKGMRGPGEKELETDQRIAQQRISLLRKRLETINQQHRVQRKNRTQLVRVALVGYTNVGKSTLMQVLSKKSVLVEDKLFATIGSTIRKVVLQKIPFLLTDTVGFIRKLPHTLIACFRSTLEEVREADLLLHVVDISHPTHREHIQVVQDTLQEIGAGNIPTILALNKADLLPEEECTFDLGTYTQPDTPAIVISAAQQKNISDLQNLLVQKIIPRHLEIYPNALLATKHHTTPE